MEKFYSTDLTLSIIEINANSKEEAEKVINDFLDLISPILKDKVRWEEADWTISENVLDEKKGEWVSN